MTISSLPLRASLIFLSAFRFATAAAQADFIYTTDINGNTIWKYDSGGNASIFAGGTGGGPFQSPAGLAFDGAGNLFAAYDYVAGSTGIRAPSAILKYDSGGNASVFVAQDGVTTPKGLAFDGNGNLYVAYGIGGIWKYGPNGSGSAFGSYVGAPLAFDNNGNLYSASANEIYKYDGSGNASVFASGYGFSGLAFDSSGRLYATSFNNVERFDQNGNASLFASGLSNPNSLAFDSAGNLYVVNYGGGAIIEFDSAGNRSVFASGPAGPNFIAIQPVPEPSTWAITLLGCLAVLSRAIGRKPQFSVS